MRSKYGTRISREEINGVMHKQCNTCGEMRPMDGFNKVANHKDGRANKCKACTNKKPGQNYTRIERVTIEGVLHKACNKCGVMQPLSEYHTAKQNPDGCKNDCKSCVRAKEAERSRVKRQDRAYREAGNVTSREYTRKRREADPAAYNAYQRAWRAANPGKSASYTRKSYYKNHEKSLERSRTRYRLNPEYFRQWAKANPEKVRTYARKWAKANPTYHREWRMANPGAASGYVSKWRAVNPEKARLSSAASKAKRRAAMLNATTGAPIDYASIYAMYDDCYLCGKVLVNPVHMDHVTPLSRGGTHDTGNLLPTHVRCNLRKSDRMLSELRWYEGPADPFQATT